MNRIILISVVVLASTVAQAQQVFHTIQKNVVIKLNNKVISKNWSLDSKIKLDVFEAEIIDENNTVTYSDGKDSIRFNLKKAQQIDFLIVMNQKDSAYQRIVATPPNVHFDQKYKDKHKGKTVVAIPEVSELVNVLMAMHPDAEKESNMFDVKVAYYKKAKEYFAPYMNHQAMDTIQKYIKELTYLEENGKTMFSYPSYYYYYALKMNACAYSFNANGNIVNDGNIKQMAKGWNTFDPMKDVKVFEDFARVSNFRQFYKENQTYYNELLATYNQLNPIHKMQSWLDKKFGFGYGSYVVYFSPLINGAHSTNRFENNGLTQTIMFIAKAHFDESKTQIENELLASRVVFTEIDHNYVNPVSDKFIEKINKALSNRAVWAEPKITDAYQNPYKVFNEYMTFAVYGLYVNDNYQKEDAEKYLPQLESMMADVRGFSKFKTFNQTLLAKYKENPLVKMEDLYEYMLKWCDRQNQL